MNSETSNVDKLLEDHLIVLALRVLIRWKTLKTICRERTSCKDCPYALELEISHKKHYICSIATDEKILFKVADIAERLFIEKGIPT